MLTRIFLVLLFFTGVANAIEITIEDARTGKTARVTPIGQVVVGAFDFNVSTQAEIGEDNVAVNFLIPRAGFRFLIDCIVMFGDRQVGANTNATVEIYESTNTTSRVVSRSIYRDEIAQTDRFQLCGMNLEVREGFFINGVTNDDDIHVNILGHFIPKE